MPRRETEWPLPPAEDGPFVTPTMADIARMVERNRSLESQVDQLQEANSREVERRREAENRNRALVELVARLGAGLP